MYWSPVVPSGNLTQKLARIERLELILNDDFSKRIAELRKKAQKATHFDENPSFRLLQILAHLRN